MGCQKRQVKGNQREADCVPRGTPEVVAPLVQEATVQDAGAALGFLLFFQAGGHAGTKPCRSVLFSGCSKFPDGICPWPYNSSHSIAAGVGGGCFISTLQGGGSVGTEWATYFQGGWLSPEEELLPAGAGGLRSVRLQGGLVWALP